MEPWAVWHDKELLGETTLPLLSQCDRQLREAIQRELYEKLYSAKHSEMEERMPRP